MSAKVQIEIDEGNRRSAPPLLHLIFVRDIYLRWVHGGLCKDSSARGTLRTGDGGGWTIVRINILRLDT